MTNQVQVLKAQIVQAEQKVKDLENKVSNFYDVVNAKRFVAGPSYSPVVVSFSYDANTEKDTILNVAGINHYTAFSRGEDRGAVTATLTPLRGDNVDLDEKLLHSISEIKMDLMSKARNHDMNARKELYIAQQELQLTRSKLRTAYYEEEVDNF